MNRACVAILAACLLAASIALASINNSSDLAVPTKIESTGFQRYAEIRLEIIQSIRELTIIDVDTLRSLGQRQIVSRNRLFDEPTGAVFFPEAEEITVVPGTEFSDGKSYCVRANVDGIDYSCLIFAKSPADRCEVVVTPYGVYDAAKRRGAVKVLDPAGDDAVLAAQTPVRLGAFRAFQELIRACFITRTPASDWQPQASAAPETIKAPDAVLARTTDAGAAAQAARRRYAQPSDLDILALTDRARLRGIEIFMPASQVPNDTAGRIRRLVGQTFAARLTSYADIAHLTRIVRDPEHSVIMTVGLTEAEIALLGRMRWIARVRLINFESADLSAMSRKEHVNFIAEAIGILLVARIMDGPEACDRRSPAYLMLAHLLEDHIDPAEKIDRYIRAIVDEKIGSVARLRYLAQTALKALRLEHYRRTIPAIDVLWAA